MVERAAVLLAALACACTIPHKLGDVQPMEDAGEDNSGTGTSGGFATDSASSVGSMSTTSAGEVTTGIGDPYAACGVEIDNSGPPGLWMCGCSICNIEQMDLTPDSRASFQGACDCLCDAFGCGFPTTASTGAQDDSASGETTDSGGTAGSTAAESTSTTSGGEETISGTGSSDGGSDSSGG